MKKIALFALTVFSLTAMAATTEPLRPYKCVANSSDGPQPIQFTIPAGQNSVIPFDDFYSIFVVRGGGQMLVDVNVKGNLKSHISFGVNEGQDIHFGIGNVAYAYSVNCTPSN